MHCCLMKVYTSIVNTEAYRGNDIDVFTELLNAVVKNIFYDFPHLENGHPKFHDFLWQEVTLSNMQPVKTSCVALVRTFT